MVPQWEETGINQNGLVLLCTAMEIGFSIINLAGFIMARLMEMVYGYGVKKLNGLGQEVISGPTSG